MNEPMGRLDLEAGAGPQHRLGHRSDGFVLADDAPVEDLVQLEQLSRSPSS